MATTSAERMRWKRARDRGMVWGEGDESQLSDTALIEQLAIACQKARARATPLPWACSGKSPRGSVCRGSHCDNLLSLVPIRR